MRKRIQNVYDFVLQYKKLTGLASIMLAFFALGFLVGWFTLATWFHAENEPEPFLELRLEGYDLISPLLECGEAKGVSASKELQPFKYKISAFIEELKQQGDVTHISVYFRELNNGLMFGIDGGEKFTPASMIKVPLMLAYLKGAESSPSLLKDKIIRDNPADLNDTETFKPSQAIEFGRSYTVDDLLRYTIAYSDNNAYFLLFSRINPKLLRIVYTDLGLEIPSVRTRDDYMTVTEYASFFRVLYNGSYLGKELSQKALTYLTEVDFRAGLVSGVPPNIRVAHKFGERTTGEQGEIKQLHDCGIIYYPRHPYLLCIMSRGKSFEYLDDAIRKISSLTFEELDTQHEGHLLR